MSWAELTILYNYGLIYNYCFMYKDCVWVHVQLNYFIYLLQFCITNKILYGYYANNDYDAPIYNYFYENDKFKNNDQKYINLMKELLGKFYKDNLTAEKKL